MKQALCTLLVFLLASPASASYSLARPKTRVMGSPAFSPSSRWVESRQAPETRWGIVVVVYDCASEKSEWTYDLANRVLTERNGLNLGPTYTYDAAGRKATRLDGNGQLTTFGYDDVGRRTSETFSDGTKNEWGFDSRGNRNFEKSPNHERTLLFDELGRLKQVDDVTFGRTIVYGYDANGNRTSITEGGVTQRFTYDSRNLLIAAQEGSSQPVQLKYDALGRRTAIIRPNGVRTDFAFDDVDQVASITHSKSGTTLLGFSYLYDTEGMRTRKTRDDGTWETYSYDTSRRLTGVRYSTGRTIGYGLDAWGNFQTVQDSPSQGAADNFTTNAFSQVTSINNFGTPVASFTYDNNGNTLTETRTGQTATYSWTKGNRLASVSSTAGVHTFEYDARGIRTKKNESGSQTRFLLDGASVLQELDSANITTARYLNNPQVVDEQLAFGRGGADYWPLHDALGSIVAVSDANGAIVNRFDYGVQGERTVTGAGPPLAFGFTGREHDAFGKRYHRDRYVDPALSAFTQPDRLGLIDGPNLYKYVGADPVMHTDPSGRTLAIAFARPALIGAGMAWIGAGLATFGVGIDNYMTNDEWEDFVEYGLAQILGGFEMIMLALTMRTGAQRSFCPESPIHQQGTHRAVASLDDLVTMMNRRPNVNAQVASGDAERYLRAVQAEGSHMFTEGGVSQILIRRDVGNRWTAFHEWLHRRLQLRNGGAYRPGEDDLIEKFLLRHKKFFRI